MYENLALLALLVFFYSVIAGRIERSAVSGPIIFVVAGLILGPQVLGWLDGDATSAEFRVIADLALALILFLDAANADLVVLRRQIKIPSRMLLIGLPGSIALGFAFAALIFDELSLIEAAILGTMLAATDAALGKGVITNPAVPARIREGLNAESGLNDGLCVPVLLVFIALAEGANAHGSADRFALKLLAEELGIGLAVGLGLTAIGGSLIRFFWQWGWVTEVWMRVSVVALALAAFAVAQSLHGSGYIAAFTGGLLFGFLAKDATHKLVASAESESEILAMLCWLVFGAAVIGQQIAHFTWDIVVYSILSLTIVRVLPIFIALGGSGESVSSRLFFGWFGPRGLASIVFAIIVLNTDIPGAEFMARVVVCTVFLSLLAHGISAKPLAKLLAAKEGRKVPKKARYER